MIAAPVVNDDDLCPFCDEPLPLYPSARLQRLLDRARVNARPQARIGNSKGLKAPFATFVGVCNQHRNETTVIPEGVAQGWPTDISFDELPGRLKIMRPRLLRIVEQPNNSPFYREAMENIASMGALAAAGAVGQMNAFERSRPG